MHPLPRRQSVVSWSLQTMASSGSGPSDEAMRGLASAVDAAEALEASGKYVEAADSVAKSLTVAYQEYVQSKNTGPTLARPPPMPLPRRSYVERYKRRLRVDWEKWDRTSRRPVPMLAGIQPTEGNGEEDDDADDDDADDDESVADGVYTLSVDGSEADATSVSRGSRTASWQPKTLVRNWTAAPDGSATGKVEIVHTCADGQRVTVTVSPPDIPPRAQHMFNANAKATVKALVEGDKDLSERTFSYAELACWALTSEKISKNKLGDYLGRSDDHAVGTMTAVLTQLDFKQARNPTQREVHPSALHTFFVTRHAVPQHFLTLFAMLPAARLRRSSALLSFTLPVAWRGTADRPYHGAVCEEVSLCLHAFLPYPPCLVLPSVPPRSPTPHPAGRRYTDCHPDVFISSDTAYVLAFSVIMLKTDAHSPQARRQGLAHTIRVWLTQSDAPPSNDSIQP